jgi:hypothetical protein
MIDGDTLDNATPTRPRLFQHDAAILGLWKLGLDTFDIARQLTLHEHEIANRLARLRDAGAA